VRLGSSAGLFRTAAIALAPVVAATVGRAALDPVFGEQLPFITYFGAVAFAGWYGGFAPGFLAAVASGVVADWFFIAPRHAIGVLVDPTPQRLLAIGTFLATAAVVAVLGGVARRAAAEARGAAREAERRQAELEVEVRERARIEAELRSRDDAGALLAAIVESSEDAIVGKTLDGRIVSWNKGAERVFGYTRDEAVGRPVAMLLPADRMDEEPRVLERLARGERVEHFEALRVRKSGEVIHVSESVSPIRNAQGTIVGAAKIARDITAQKRFEAERERLLAREQAARAEAEAASNAKDAFLATVSHELRTPLSPILSWSIMLRQGKVGADKSTRALETIERCARAQAQLIDDLLDVSRIVTGKMRLDVRPTDLGAVAQSAVEVVRPAADAKEIRIRTVIDPGIGRVSGDRERLQQVVWNLLSNAIKFTPKGGRVQLTVERVDSHVEMAVADNGQGIPPELLPQIFGRFIQGDSRPTRAHGGLGLGLAIVRHIVELHGGTVHAESGGAGTGAVFTVNLPVTAVRTAGETEHRHPVEPTTLTHADYPDLRDVRVLVVDDDPAASEAVASVISGCGADVRTAASAPQALEMLDVWSPDVLVSDIGMPGDDGYGLIARLRAREDRLGEIPAIALTAYATVEDRVRILAAGFQTHVAKPVEPVELAAIVASVARGARVGATARPA